MLGQLFEGGQPIAAPTRFAIYYNHTNNNINKQKGQK
jgi:hypothetical protein